jgi:deferrochelatase/peroxidase EfeB
MGGRESTYDRRLLRVGVPFGNSLVNRYAPVDEDPEKGNRGLLFLCVQASIERQFEFLVSSWANDPSRPKMPGGNDMLIGQNSVPADGVRRCSLFGSGLQQAQLSASQQWVIPTGGGYFFMPSISALSGVLAK